MFEELNLNPFTYTIFSPSLDSPGTFARKFSLSNDLYAHKISPYQEPKQVTKKEPSSLAQSSLFTPMSSVTSLSITNSPSTHNAGSSPSLPSATSSPFMNSFIGFAHDKDQQKVFAELAKSMGIMSQSNFPSPPGSQLSSLQTTPSHYPSMFSEFSNWTPDDDAKLRQGVEMFGTDWSKIANEVLGNKTEKECMSRWSEAVSQKIKKKHNWTAEEDAMLMKAYAMFPKQWAKIASLIPGRTNQQVKQRWSYVLDDNIKNGSWSAEEDQLLNEGYERFGKQWAKIAQTIPGRTNIQCRNRWKDVLDPSIRNTPWSEAEDMVLQQGFLQFGSKWSKIATLLPGRTGLQCRDRFLRKSSDRKKRAATFP